jgi:Xaa-Pro aminopeptidase
MDTANSADALMASGAVFRARRARVLSLLRPEEALILVAAPEVVVGRDTEQRYVVDAELFYLTGYREPEAVAVFVPGAAHPFTMFVRARDATREIWTGPRGGLEAARETFGADEAYPISEIEQKLPQLVAGADTLYARLDSGRADIDRLIQKIVVDARRWRPRKGRGPQALVDPGALLDELRLFKDAEEVVALRCAAQISAAAFRDVLPQIRAGVGEWQIEAALEAGFRTRGATGFSFPTIVASGPNATVLHHVSNDRVLQDGELVPIDAGARYGMYCGDITRTFPVNGSFTPLQRSLYEAVLRAHDAAIAAARPGNTIDHVQEAALREMLAWLKELQLLEKSVDEALADDASYKRYCPHKTSHWLGLEVHDVGDYVVNGEPRQLLPGMVITIEPGLSLPTDTATLPAELRGAGVRIEDDVLITEDGAEVLTTELPTAADEVEAMLREARS